MTFTVTLDTILLLIIAVILFIALVAGWNAF
jgi:hypothetical protein